MIEHTIKTITFTDVEGAATGHKGRECTIVFTVENETYQRARVGLSDVDALHQCSDELCEVLQRETDYRTQGMSYLKIVPGLD